MLSLDAERGAGVVMNLRHILLRLMLWSLGIGAVLGAVAVLFTSYDVMWRVVSTCFVTALAALLILGCSMLMDKPRARGAGMAGMVGVLLEFFLTLLLIWNAPRLFNIRRLDDCIALTIVFSIPLVVVLMLALWARQSPLTRVMGNVGVALVAAEFLLLSLAIWGEPLWRDDDWYGTAAAFAIFGVMALAALVGAARRDGRWWRWISVLGAIVAFGMSIWGIWISHSGSETLFAAIIAIAAFPAYANVLMLCPLRSGQGWLRVVTLGAALVTAVCIVAAIYFRFGSNYELLSRVGAAGAIIAACGTLALLVLARLNRRADFKPELTDITEISIVCPICRKKQTVALGESACASCGLQLHIRVEEPRCPNCNYLLVMLHSDRCPECGTPLATPTRSLLRNEAAIL